MARRNACKNAASGWRAAIVPIAVALSVAGCSEYGTSGSQKIVFLPPLDASASTVSSSLSPQQVVRAFQDAGFTNVSLHDAGRAVRVRTNTAAMIDCGELVQTALGNRTVFPGDAPLAAILVFGVENGVLLRRVSAESQADLTQSGEGKYTVNESHRVSLEYRRGSSDKQGVWVRQAEFDGETVGRFEDNTLCRSAGIAQDIL